MSRYARFTNLRVDGPDDDGVIELVLDAPHLNAVGEAAHATWPRSGASSTPTPP